MRTGDGSDRTAPDRSGEMILRRSGRSGLVLPALSLGLWHNFGAHDSFDNARALITTAFDAGIFHFDLANNYGPPPGSAEEAFGRILAADFSAHRDEWVIATKAGYRMGPGPHGDGGSRKSLLESLDASLKRLRIDHVDIFYHHRPDPGTPLEETLGALTSAVVSGKALYAGLSNYDAAQTAAAVPLLRAAGTPCVLHQTRYNIFDRRAEKGLFDCLLGEKIGCIVFSPLDQGILTGKYLAGIPSGSRASKPGSFLAPKHITAVQTARVAALAEIARAGGRTPAQLAIAWVLRRAPVVSALIGANHPDQIRECATAAGAVPLSDAELEAIAAVCDNDG
jgi:L-glyceraldehyde 3-phosphate reductase